MDFYVTFSSLKDEISILQALLQTFLPFLVHLFPFILFFKDFQVWFFHSLYFPQHTLAFHLITIYYYFILAFVWAKSFCGYSVAMLSPLLGFFYLWCSQDPLPPTSTRYPSCSGIIDIVGSSSFTTKGTSDSKYLPNWLAITCMPIHAQMSTLEASNLCVPFLVMTSIASNSLSIIDFSQLKVITPHLIILPSFSKICTTSTFLWYSIIAQKNSFGVVVPPY